MLLLAREITKSLALYNLGTGLLISLFNGVLLYFASFKFMQTMQQSGYDGRGYFSWLKRKDNIYMQRLLMLSLLSFLAYLIFNMSLVNLTDSDALTLIGLIFYFVCTIYYVCYDRKIKSKVPLVKTARMTRLMFTHFIVLFFITMIYTLLLSFIAYWISESLIAKLRYGFICWLPLLIPFNLLLAFYINEPFERYNYRRYIRKCKAKLYENSALLKIGITGSYGKTSVKEILATVLSEKYRVLATPHSYNTPMGICKTVNSLNESHEVFIAEMGARNVGDIRELAKIVKPQFAIISGIIGQHIETMKSLTNIKKAKYELIEEMGANGFAVFSADNSNTTELYEKCSFRKIEAGIDATRKPFVFADKITVTRFGTKFRLHVGKETADCETVLIGTHNVSNICLAVGIANELGLTMSEICSGIARIKPIKHRLELVENSNNVTIIDDSFNSNVNGTIAAMEVLNCFTGRKIVITPGFVELGKFEEYENYEFGRRLATHVSIVILVGKRRVDKIKDGLISADFSEENIIKVKDLSDAKKALSKLMKPDDVILFENDLPDKFI